MNTQQETARTAGGKEQNTGNEAEGLSEIMNEKKTGRQEGSLDENLQQVDSEHIGKLEAEISEEKDKLLRLLAEFENYKKRNLRERADLIKTAGEDIIASILPVLDDFDRALKNTGSVDPAIKEGMQLIHQKLKLTLELRGLSVMESVGKPFDTDLHDAITNIPVPDQQKGIVMDEAEKGYYLNGKVIRHAKVIVGN